MKKTIIILIADFNVDEINGYEEYQTRWKIMEEKLKIVLTDVFEIDIIELPKVKIALENGTFEGFGNLKEWMDFFINPNEEASQMDDLDEKIKKAYEEWQKLNENEEERELAETRYRNLLRLQYAKEYEYKLGKKDTVLHIAKEMLKDNVDISLIIKYTGLKKEEIENL